MFKLRKVNQEQIDYIFRMSNALISKYQNMDLTSEDVWKNIVNDANTIANKCNDFLTGEIIVATVTYLDELAKEEMKNKVSNPAPQVNGFNNGSFQGFKVEQVKGFKTGC